MNGYWKLQEFLNESLQRNGTMVDINVSEVLNTFITIFGVLVIGFTVLGNSLVILAIIVDKRLRRVGNIFIVSLAASDMLVGILVAPLSLTYQLTHYWTLGRIVCDFWTAMDVSCCTASIVNLCIISYDRYNAITQPLRYARYRTCKRASILVVLVWIYSLGIALPPLLGWHKPTERQDPKMCSITQEIGYTFYSTIGAFYLPLCVMLGFYINIFRITSRRGQQWERGPGSSRLVRQLHLFRKRKSKCSERKCCTCCFEANPSEFELAENPDTRRSSSSSSSSAARHGTQCTSGSDGARGSILVSPRHSIQSPQREVVIQVTQGRRKQTIQRKCLMRQISNVTSSDSSNITSSGSTSTTGTTLSETSFSDSSDQRSRRRVSSVLNNLVAANIIQIAALQEGIRAVKFADLSRRSVFDAVGEEDEGEVNTEEDLRHQTKEEPMIVPNDPPKRQSKRRKNVSLPQERRAVRTLGIVVGCFIVCWLPFFIVTLVKPLCQNCINKIVEDIVLWLGYFNSACNPVIYTFFNKDFRAAFRKLCLCKSIQSPTYL
ncbi:hypothetical protein FSP39_005952 [Pinctada imbricata]|uniref:G-protein coupled receptors family 1 profile domain-containing protein n=1 Tax=Pinctada imbricata TaxID=66713 RepID=A0AA88Y2K6_PINIB|nr:hypothetical protein FSP39_005952 [Pinctada imbricata]